MASIAMLVGGALVNALAFSGSNYLFSKLRNFNADEESKRHDLAVEHLQAAHIAWSQKRTEHLNWINEELRHQGHAVKCKFDGVLRRFYKTRYISRRHPILSPVQGLLARLVRRGDSNP